MAVADTKTKIYQSKIDIRLEDREPLVELINRQLADTFDLYSQAKQAHWNVKGINFFQLHELFDALAASIEPYVDMLAERVTALGGVAMGTVRMAAAQSTLSEYPSNISTGDEHLRVMTDRVAAYAKSTREALRHAGELNDPTTEDLFTEISREVDKNLYFLEAHLN